jgi:solute carrier family 25 folate transporter 32
MPREGSHQSEYDYILTMSRGREGAIKTPSQLRGGPGSRIAAYSTKLSDGSVNALCGATAGIASGIVTCPLDVIKTRLQAQGSFRRMMSTRIPPAHLYNGLIGTARTIWLQDGIRGMYRGLGPMLLGYLPTWAVYMSVYDSSRNYYYTHIGKSTDDATLYIIPLTRDRKQMAH